MHRCVDLEADRTRAVLVIPNGRHRGHERQLRRIRPGVIEGFWSKADRQASSVAVHALRLEDGLQGLDGRRITIPARDDQRPNPKFLEERYEIFSRAS